MRQMDYSRVAELLQTPFVVVAIYWFMFYPPPGYAVAVLALAATIMAVRTDHFTRTEQVIWILLAGALCFIEFRAIRKDRDEHDKQEAAIRWRDDFNRKQERRQFSALIDSGKTILSTEQHLSMTTMDALTGGESFCYLEARSFGGENVVEALLLQKGSNPLFNVDVEVTDIDLLKPPIDFATLSKARSNFSVPFVRAGTFATPLFEIKPAASIQSKSYNVFIIARNGRFTERLRLRRVNGHWLSAKRVDASYYSKRVGLVLEEIDKEFPRDVLNADGDWKAVDKLKHIQIR